MSWIYKGKDFTDEDIPEGAVGFVYRMHSIIGGFAFYYVGKKNFFSNAKVKLSKKAMPVDKRLKKYKRVLKTSYQNYYSSNDILKDAHKKGIVIKREILMICFSKTELTYQEVKHQFLLNVLEDTNSLNGNIMGKFYKQIKNNT
jgi:hypothetical protein